MILPFHRTRVNPFTTPQDDTLSALAAQHLATEQDLARLERAQMQATVALLAAQRRARVLAEEVEHAQVAQAAAYRAYRRALRYAQLPTRLELPS